MKQFVKISGITSVFVGLLILFYSCKTHPSIPDVTTDPITGITLTSAISGGNVISDGNAEVTVRGVCWSISENPTTSDNKTLNGSGTGLFTSNLDQLTPGTKYFVRAYATNSEGTAYGSQQTFTTNSVQIASLTSTQVTSINITTAISGGNITSDGGGTITERGVCWNTSENPVITDSKTSDGDGTGSFTSNLTGLSANTVYYIRAYATNSAGTAYGNQLTFTTLNTGQFYDIDGNLYNSITIGSQIWMVENLMTTKFNDGSDIPLVEDAGAWSVLNAPGYCWYNNDEATNKNLYGALYHWLTGNTGKLCPTGWHLPSDAEWTILTDYLGGEDLAGEKLKESGTTHWASPNTGATNETGFSALPGGYRAIDGSFDKIGNNGFWDSSTEYNTSNRYGRVMSYDSSNVYRARLGKRRGLSVRCIKD
jgi:uncharacterized protein (TIGR02145 family)